MNFSEIVQYEFLQNKIEYWIISIGAFVIFFTLLYIFYSFLIRLLKRFSKKTETNYDNFLVAVVCDIKYSVIFLISTFAGIQFIYIAEDWMVFIKKIIIFYITVRIALFLQKFFVKKLQRFVITYISHLDSNFQKRIKPLVNKILSAIIWITAFLLIISNLGYNLTSLIAGLGIGGIFIGLAAQETLSNFFGSLSVFLDQPFDIGDMVEVNGIVGTVEDLGLRSTRIRTFDDTLVVIPNNDVAKSMINNISKRIGVRTDLKIGVIYQTSTDNIKKAIQIIQDTLASHSKIHENFRVHFTQFADSALILEAVYFIEPLQFIEIQDVRQDINIRIKSLFEKEGIEFAYPTQTLYLNKQ